MARFACDGWADRRGRTHVVALGATSTLCGKQVPQPQVIDERDPSCRWCRRITFAQESAAAVVDVLDAVMRPAPVLVLRKPNRAEEIRRYLDWRATAARVGLSTDKREWTKHDYARFAEAEEAAR